MSLLSRRGFVISSFVATALAFSGATIWWNSRDPLVDVHAGIVKTFPAVAHVSPEEFSQLDSATLVLFDTREEDEFAVSHLPGAIRVSPGLPADEFLAEYGDQVAGKTVVFYCSVGARSSQFANDVQSGLQARGAVQISNLERGLFGWHNDGRLLVRGDGGETQAIHPYDAIWGRLVDRQALTAYEP